jgi:hypothetical protein
METPSELREAAYVCKQGVARATDPRTRESLIKRALHLAQLAEQAEREAATRRGSSNEA